MKRLYLVPGWFNADTPQSITGFSTPLFSISVNQSPVTVQLEAISSES